jgi:ADP-heptose:LPS heptosyltransferase
LGFKTVFIKLDRLIRQINYARIDFFRFLSLKIFEIFFVRLIVPKKNFAEKPADFDVVIFRLDSKLGDSVILVSFLRKLAQIKPTLKLAIFCSPEWTIFYKNYLTDFQNLEVISTKKNILSAYRVLRQWGSRSATVSLETSSVLKAINLLFISQVKATKRINLLAPRHRVFDVHAFFNWGKDPVIYRYFFFVKKLAQVFGWGHLDFELKKYDFPVSQEAIDCVAKLGLGEFVVLNSMASKLRSLNQETTTKIVLALLDKFDFFVISLATPDQVGEVSRWVSEAQALHQGRWKILPEVDSLEKTAALIQRAKLCISPDTGIVHLACGVGTPVVGLYRKDFSGSFQTETFFNAQVWAPFGVAHRVVWSHQPAHPSSGTLTEPFSAEDVTINGVSVDEVINASRELLGR